MHRATSHGLTVIALSFAVLGCATITKGTEQSVALTTPGVTGAQCTLNSSVIGTKVVQSPATMTLPKGADNITVVCKKECYHDGTGIIAASVEEMAAGNVIVGGVVGLGVDAMSGAMNKYNTDNQVSMVPIQGCVARGRA